MVKPGKNNYRQLYDEEIAILTSRGCSAEDWSLVLVKENFNPLSCSRTRFSGNIKLGVFEKTHTDASGVEFRSGISNATIHNCIIGDNVSVINVHEYLANYIIGDEVIIRNCGRISCDGISSFGNGTLISVLDESGGRSIRIFDRLSSHLAYIYCLFRHRRTTIEQIDKLVQRYASDVSSGMGYAGKGSVLINCGLVRNVRLGEYSRVEGAIKLEEGTLLGSEDAPVIIGHGVIMNNFIAGSGSVITDGVIAERCFVGQGCLLAKQFSATDSLFFANCQGFHGEAVSVFAGPFTVTHHKSTLLIAGMFSFMNAGSGTNQSNHLYKLGPLHHGIVERGSKTASGSYLLWPSHIGPFSLVAGNHKGNIDTSVFPFSYVMEKNGETFVHPALNLRSSGTYRDALKWPERDRRKGSDKADHIVYSLITPYTAGKMKAALEILQSLAESTHGTGEHQFNNFKIKSSSVRRGIELYEAGIKKYSGDIFIKRLSGKDFRNGKELSGLLECRISGGRGEWTDLAGLIAPVKRTKELLDKIESGRVTSALEIEEFFRNLHSDYDELEWSWVSGFIENNKGRKPADLSPEEILGILDEWQEAETTLHKLILEDARKEFSPSSMTGFGAGLGKKEKEEDFRAVRGDSESHPFIIRLEKELNEKISAARDIAARLRAVPK